MDKNESLLLNQKQSGKYFSLMILLYLFITFIGQIILDAIKVEGALYYAISSTFSLLALIISLIVFWVTNKGNTLTKLSINKCSIKDIFLSILLSSGMFFGLGFVNTAFVNLLNFFGVSVGGASIPLTNIFELIIFIVLLAILPAVLEELFFRGLMVSLLNGTTIITLVISVGLSFSLYHCSLAQFIYQFIYGVGLTLLVILSKSVLPCIIAHLLNNLTVILLEYFKVNIDLFNPLIIVLGLIVLAVFFALTVINIIKNEKQKSQKSTQKIGVKHFYAYAFLGMLICLILIISSIFGG